MTKTNIMPAVLVAGAIVLLAISFLFNPLYKVKADNAYTSSQTNIASTTVTVAVTTSTRILSTSSPAITNSSQRIFANICNLNSTAGDILALRLNGDKPEDARTTGGILVAPGACYTIDDLKMYTGSIQASSTSGNSINALVNNYEN